MPQNKKDISMHQKINYSFVILFLLFFVNSKPCVPDIFLLANVEHERDGQNIDPRDDFGDEDAWDEDEQQRQGFFCWLPYFDRVFTALSYMSGNFIFRHEE